MLDFFRNGVLEKQNYGNKKENKKRYIFSNSTKGIIYFLGVLYLISGGLSIWSVNGKVQVFTGIKFIFLAVIDLAALICISFKKKKTEMAALILVVAFIVIMYSTTMIFI